MYLKLIFSVKLHQVREVNSLKIYSPNFRIDLTSQISIGTKSSRFTVKIMGVLCYAYKYKPYYCIYILYFAYIFHTLNAL